MSNKSKRKRSNQLCACGCGQYTFISKQHYNYGKPNKYIHGHSTKGKNNGQWNGGFSKDRKGYILMHYPEHINANSKGYIRRSHFIAEMALGKPLPKNAVVHHVNEIKNDDRPDNLVICEDIAYHALLHQRLRALQACGNVHWRKCKYCKEYDDPNNLYISPNGKSIFHRKCFNKYNRENRKKNGDKIRAYHRKYALMNKDKMKEYSKKSYLKNRDKILKRQKKRREMLKVNQNA